MTAITLNLLADELEAQQAEARDPLKIAIACGAMVVCLAVVGGTALRLLAGSRRNQAAALQRQWEQIEASQQANAVTAYEEIKAVADEILRINQTRLLLAPELAMVKDAIPPTVQLTRLRLQLVTETPESSPIPPPTKEAGEFKVRRAAPKPIERLTLQLEGRAYGAKPELEVDAFMKSLRENPAYAERLDQINLRSIARSSTEGDKPAAELSAVFVLECQFKPRS